MFCYNVFLRHCYKPERCERWRKVEIWEMREGMNYLDEQSLAAGINVHYLSSCTHLRPISPALIHIEVNSSACLHGSPIKALRLCTFPMKTLWEWQDMLCHFSRCKHPLMRWAPPTIISAQSWFEAVVSDFSHVKCLDFLTKVVLKSHLSLWQPYCRENKCQGSCVFFRQSETMLKLDNQGWVFRSVKEGLQLISH